MRMRRIHRIVSHVFDSGISLPVKVGVDVMHR